MVINAITEMNFPKRPEIVKSQNSKSQVVALDFQDQVSVFIVRENKIRIAAREPCLQRPMELANRA